jgi:hypothetical protein
MDQLLPDDYRSDEEVQTVLRHLQSLLFRTGCRISDDNLMGIMIELESELEVLAIECDINAGVLQTHAA